MLSLGLGSLATSCGTQSGLTLTPKPVHLESGGWRDSALAIAAAVAARHELPRSETATAERGNGTRACFARPSAWFCVEPMDDRLQLQIGNVGRGLSPTADSVRAELTEELSARFGAEAVAACQWRSVPDSARSRWWRPLRRAICVVPQRPS